MPDDTKMHGSDNSNEKKVGAAGPDGGDAAAPQPGAGEDNAPEKQSNGAGESGETPSPTDELTILKTERDSLKEQLLRAVAEADNVPKRAEREKPDIAKFAISKFAQDIIGVGDSFQAAIAAVSAEAADKDPALKSFLEGVTLAEKAFLGALVRHGVTRIDPAGEIFSPHRHHAVSEEEKTDIPAGTITKVFQVGYLLEERVLRPAMVVVARGGPKPAPEEPAASAMDKENAGDERAPGEPKSKDKESADKASADDKA